MNNLDKALQTNSSQNAPIDKKCVLDVPEFREPDFNAVTIQKKITKLDKEVTDMQTTYLINGLSPDLVIELQAKIAMIESLKQHLKTEKLRCSCETSQFTRTVDENSNALCGGCGKRI
jgi:hypothetical protein